MLDEGARTEDVEALRTKLGLDRPILVQCGAFLGGIASGSLGTAFRFGTPVMTEIAAPAGHPAARRRRDAGGDAGRAVPLA